MRKRLLGLRNGGVMARVLAIGLSVIGWVAGANAGPPSALPTRTVTPVGAIDPAPFVDSSPAPMVVVRQTAPVVNAPAPQVLQPAPQVLQPAPANVVLAPAPVVQAAPQPAHRCPCEQV